MVMLLLKLSGALLGTYLLVLTLIWWGQEWLLFRPQTLPADHRFNLPDDVKEVWVDVPGAKLHALHLRRPQPRGLVFFLHGNAGSLQDWFVNSDFYRQQNLDLVMLDYRGYGKSTGRIENEAQLHADVMVTWQSVAAQPQYLGKQRIIFGRSLGTGLAAHLAAQVQPELTVMVSPYFSMLAMAQDRYPWVPSGLSRYPLRTDQVLGRVKGPVLLVHGGVDRMINPSHSQRLKAVVPQVELLVLPEAGHNDLQEFAQYGDALRAAFAKLLHRP
jgi:uncharacterized protein